MLLPLLGRHLRPYRRLLVVVVVLQLLGTAAALFLPSLNADIIDRGIARGDTGYILRTGVVMLSLSLGQVLATVGSVYAGARTAMSFGRDLPTAVFAQVGTFGARELGVFGAPSLITRNTNDVQQVQLLVLLGCTILVTAPITAVGGVIMAVRQDVGLSWLVVVSVPALGLAVGLIIRRMIPLYRSLQGRIDAVNRVLREQLTGIRVLRAFVREPYERQRFATINRELTENTLRVGRLSVLLPPIVLLVLNVSSVAVLWFGAGRIDAGQIQIGSLTAFLSYLLQILTAVLTATFMIILIPRAAVCAVRIAEVLDTDAAVTPASEPVRTLRTPGTVRVHEATFCYPGAASPVLSGVSFEAHAGQTTAIIGSTGSGKTTLLSLVPRLLDVTSGLVEVDGVDVRQLAPELLWSRLGLVPQRAFLFSGTVASNLRLGRADATDGELREALRIAQATGFVEDLPGGLEGPVSQGGTNFSGGQRQRLSIARAVVRRPAVYLLDDCFSALDVATEARLRLALGPVTADSVVLLVAQRVSSIVAADQILVLEDGRLVGRGTHPELLASCETYREIVRSQDAPVPA